jgi:hypothetical protein
MLCCGIQRTFQCLLSCEQIAMLIGNMFVAECVALARRHLLMMGPMRLPTDLRKSRCGRSSPPYLPFCAHHGTVQYTRGLLTSVAFPAMCVQRLMSFYFQPSSSA